MRMDWGATSQTMIAADLGVAVIAGLIMWEAVTTEEYVVFALVLMCILLR